MYAKILVPVDGSATARRGLLEAIRLAKALGSRVRVIHIVNDLAAFAAPELAPYSEDLLKGFREGGEAILAEARATAQSQGFKVETACIEVVGGTAGDAIVEDARKSNVDLIVLGTHGRRGLYRLVLGSDAECVVRVSPVPVLLIRGVPPGTQG